MAIARTAGTLVLLRHGESTWNLENLFTGWTDVPLSERGIREAREAGRLMREAGLRPAVVHESLLLRAIQTTQLALAEMELSWIPVRRSCNSLPLASTSVIDIYGSFPPPFRNIRCNPILSPSGASETSNQARPSPKNSIRSRDAAPAAFGVD